MPSWQLRQFPAVSLVAMTKPWWSFLSCPGAGWWHSRQLMPLRACALISYSCTTEYWVRSWHSAHFPVARTRAAVGCSVSTLGRERLRRNAARISEKAMTRARKTERKDIGYLLE